MNWILPDGKGVEIQWRGQKRRKIWLKTLDLHDWRQIITQTIIEKSSSRDVLVGKIILFRHSSKKYVEHVHQSGGIWDISVSKTGKNFCFHGVYILVYGNKYTIVFTKEFSFIVMFVSNISFAAFISINNIKYTHKKSILFSKTSNCPQTDLDVYKLQTNGLVIESNKLESITLS